jgi:hypothetical protein
MKEKNHDDAVNNVVGAGRTSGDGMKAHKPMLTDTFVSQLEVAALR